jgi:hypothetical protein
MLVVLDDSLSKLEKDDHAAIAGLENVLAASYNGEHFITTSFITARALLKLPLSLRGQAVLYRLKGSISGHGHLPYPESFVVRIIADGTPHRVSPRAWDLPINFFRKRQFPQSVVLGENMLDADAYIWGARQAKVKHKVKERCSMIPDAGGGSQTAVKLQNYLTNVNGFCFCVTDGDYRDPDSPKSDVSSLCEQSALASSWPAFATDFHARSIENIIPLDLIEDSFEDMPIPQEFHDFKKIASTDQDTTRYIDAKSGLKYCWVQKAKPNTSKHDFWTSKIAKHNLQQRADQLSKSPPKCDGEKCSKCILINGLGNGTLKRTVQYFKKNTSQKLAQRIEITSTWCDLGLSIFHWGMADKPELS